MGTTTNKIMAAKTRKARMMDAREAANRQIIDDAGDFEICGREVALIHSRSTRAERARRDEYVRVHKMLTPDESFLVATGQMRNPFIHEPGTVPRRTWHTVYYKDGTRRKVAVEKHYELYRIALDDERVDKIWDSIERRYI